MKKTAGLIIAIAAFASAAQAENLNGNFSANDMNVSLSQLYPGSVKESANPSSKTRQQATQEFLASRMNGTGAQYSAVGGYQLKMSMPHLFVEPKVAGKSREEVKAEYLASRASNSPAAYSSLDSYQVSQAFPGNAVQGKALASTGNQYASKAAGSKLQ